MQIAPVAPLVLSKIFGVPREEVAFRLRLSVDYVRRLARDPQQAQRILIAELEAILEQERAKAAMTLVECPAQAAEP